MTFLDKKGGVDREEQRAVTTAAVAPEDSTETMQTHSCK